MTIKHFHSFEYMCLGPMWNGDKLVCRLTWASTIKDSGGRQSLGVTMPCAMVALSEDRSRPGCPKPFFCVPRPGPGRSSSCLGWPRVVP